MLLVAGVVIVLGAFIGWKKSRDTPNLIETTKLIFSHLNYSLVRDFAFYKTRLYFINFFRTGHLSSKDKYYILEYHGGEQNYKVVFPKKRGPKKFTEIRDDFGEIITPYILPSMGPSYNFHGIPTTPEMLGYNKLNFIMRDGEIKSFQKEEIINI